jgi:hypothetical protein
MIKQVDRKLEAHIPHPLKEQGIAKRRIVLVQSLLLYIDYD